MRSIIRGFVSVLLILLLLGGTAAVFGGAAMASETMDECMDGGHNLIYCLWSVYMCRILTHCTGDYPW